ncbi:MMPL family transporter [Streptomyces sp. NPDC000349]|uniref:MMPL family transporter n=1 Tax=unclassified Streptomyces TaxID=2593676 RepID=UPI002786A6F1|nr:MMPL family transporter [Streptomyces sp. DSM 40167]MDQ0402117.1 RND superfamily putative drug exporter [Streptomyces sp. DSM 40167]
MFERIAELAIRRSRLVLVITAVAVVLMGVLGAGAFGKLLPGGFDDPSSQSSKAKAVISDEFGGESNLVLLVRAPEGGVDAEAVKRQGAKLAADLKKEDTVANVVSYWDTGNPDLRSKDGSQAMVLAHVKGGDTEERENAKEIIDEYTGAKGAGLTVEAGGTAAVGDDMGTYSSEDLVLAEAIALPLTLLLLLLVFGSVVSALLPLVIGLIAIVGTFAELFLLGSATSISITATNLTTALGLGLGIDYALLMVSRFREQLAKGASVDDAVRHTVHTAGRTVAFSAATVAVALAALLVFPQYFLRSFGYAGVGVVAIAAISTLFVMPALLKVLGHRVNKGQLPWAKNARRQESRVPFWGRLARTAMRRPALTALPVLAVLLLAASPLLGVTIGIADERSLPEDAKSRQVSAALEKNFNGSDAAAIHVVMDKAVDRAPLDAYAGKLSELDGVVRVEASTGTYTGGRATAPGPRNTALGRPEAQRINVVSDLTPMSDAAQDLVKDVRAVDAPEGTDALAGGRDAALVDSKDSITSLIPLAGGLIALTTFILLFLFTGSVVQPLRALVLNIVSLGAALGVMTWMFQDGHLSDLFGFTPQPMEVSMTLLMFCIAFGLSMDYEVFVTSRIKELHDEGADNETAVVNGLGHTGRIVSAAACLLAVSFFAFGTAGISYMQMFGLGSGLAILIDAVAVRGVLVPAAMRVLGRSAWYAPPFLRKAHDRFGLSEGGHEPANLAQLTYEKDPTGV